MAVCPVCRQSFDGRFQVFVPPHYDAFDSIECARRASETWGPATREPVPVILPPIEVQTPLPARRRSPLRRLGLAASAVSLSPAPAAVAAGISLVAAGTAASVYLWGRSTGGNGTPAATKHPTGTTLNHIAHRPALRQPHGGARTGTATPAGIEPRTSHTPAGKHPLRPRPAKSPAKHEAAKAHLNRSRGSNAAGVPRWRSTGQAVRTAAGSASHTPIATQSHGLRPANPPAPNAPGGNSSPPGTASPEPPPERAPAHKPSPPQTRPSRATASSTGQAPLPRRPGNGRGDRNHAHTGPPGHNVGDRNGNGHGDGDEHGHGGDE